MANSISTSYVPISSSVSPGFWNKLTELKLDVYGSDETEKHIWGFPSTIESPNNPIALLEVDSTSFNERFSGQNVYMQFHGTLINTNTIEKFKEYDKQQLINTQGLLLYEKIKNHEVLKDPTLLNIFQLLTFADIKKYQYYYWFAFPVPQGLTVETDSSYNICEDFIEGDVFNNFYSEYTKLDDIQKSYFIIYKRNTVIQVCSLFDALYDKTSLLDGFEVYFVYSNITPHSSIGSQLRGKHVKFLALNIARDNSERNLKKSFIFKVKMPDVNPKMYYSWVGWEKNERNNNGPRFVNMKNSLNPEIIAESAVDLNLKLMKWNLVPALDLEKIKKAKCLLLGAGTLGCSVARSLLGWGVRHITFVDNAIVSASNPVRQSLFTYQDSVDAKPKALAAADAVKAVFPGVVSKGYEMTIPMPGHPVGQAFVKETTEHIQKLIELIRENNIIFLLMDSRESRWLPTLLGASEQKLVINAALGFDSYLVMRHGISSTFNVKEEGEELLPGPEGFKSIRGHNLGCYFCNDVTAPGDSLKNRTLDQQCTVTRPGVSQIAGALAVELAISVLQHKEGLDSPAFYTANQNANNQKMEKLDPSVLGLVPHSIRGFLSSLEQFLPATQKYKNCVACSEYVIKEYQQKEIDFLMEVFSNSKHLQDVAQLTKMCAEINMDEVFEFGDDDPFSSSSSDRDYGF